MLPSFDCAYSVWYSNLSQKSRKNLQTTKTECTFFCLNLNKIVHVSLKEFETLNWLPERDTFNQCVNFMVLKRLMTRVRLSESSF